MTSITSAIFAGLQFSEAETAFRPWWDKVEDYSVYALLLVVWWHSWFYLITWLYYEFRVFYSYQPQCHSAILWTAHTARRGTLPLIFATMTTLGLTLSSRLTLSGINVITRCQLPSSTCPLLLSLSLPSLYFWTNHLSQNSSNLSISMKLLRQS